MRYKIVIIVVMSILSVSNMESRSFKLAVGNYSELYDIMFSYIYIETFGVFDDLYAAKTEDVQMYKEYLMGENLLTKSAITRDALLPDNCIFGFRPMTIHPADTYLILLLSAKPQKGESNFLNGRSWAYFLYLTSPLSSFQELREAIPMLRRA